MSYNFYGWRTAGHVKTKNHIYKGIETPIDLYDALSDIFGGEQFGEEAKKLCCEGNERQERESAMHFGKEEKKLRYEYLKRKLAEMRAT